MTSEELMCRALSLAERARGKTSPNPMVGAVLVKEGEVVGEGFHQKAGLSHAEIEALKAAGENAKGATLYINFEPCCIYGKTPPCTDALIAAKISKVVVSIVDPNPKVKGAGIKQLREAGITVEVGLFSEEATRLNEAFAKWITTRTPFVMLKMAISLDGKIATANGDSKWITSEESRAKAREMRGGYDAILVGVNTVIKDDPDLTTRIAGSKSPIRIVLDSHLRIPPDSRVLKSQSDTQTLLVTAVPYAEQFHGVKVVSFRGEDGRVDLHALSRYLGENEVTSLLVEGGAGVHGSFLRSQLVDKISCWIAPKLLGNEGAKGPIEGWGVQSVSEALRLKEIQVSRIEDELYIEGYPVWG